MRSHLAVLALASLAVMAGCATVRVWDVRPEAAARAVRNVLGERPLGAPEAPCVVPAGGVQPPLDPSPTTVEAAARLDLAHRREVWSRDDALRLYLQAMALACESMRDPSIAASTGSSDARTCAARSVYNQALERFLRAAGGRVFRLDDRWRAEMAERGIQVALGRDGDLWPPDQFHELRFPDDYVVRGVDHYYGSNGIGVPLIAVRRPTQSELDNRQGPDRFYPFWEVYPVTALLRFESAAPGQLSAVLELHDTLRFTQAEFAGSMTPLAADLTTPTAYHFARGRLSRYEAISLLTPQNLRREAGLHMLHPYERGKIPVVMIHGLASSPKAWGKVVNELRGDPALRKRYQFWMYMYPTGNPFVLTAADFRRSLLEARRTVDPDAADPAFDQMVLVGHSMGGLISRLAITQSGDELWRLISNQPFEHLVAEPEIREMLRRVFFFEPLPFVRRTVFIATPHRGSNFSNSLIARLSDRLIRLPSPLEKAHDAVVAQNPPDFFTPMFLDGVPTSIDELRPDHAYLLTLDRLPIAERATAHSIIGRIGSGPLEKSSDGVVPYTSSHLDWVASERVVPINHFCQDHRETIDEIRRILVLHLSESATELVGAPATTPR